MTSEMMTCRGVSPVILCKEGCDAAVLVLQRPPVDLGRMGCEHHFRVLHASVYKVTLSAVLNTKQT